MVNRFWAILGRPMPPRSVAPLRCLVVDEHPVVRQGVRALLERAIDGVEVVDAPTVERAVEDTTRGDSDVVVFDPCGAAGAVEAVVLELRERTGADVVVFTSNGGRLLGDALRAGVKGYVRKDSPPEDLVRAIQAARAGEFYVDPAMSSTIVLDDDEQTLTCRQREILQMLADGMQTEAVARRLGLSTETVRTHTKRIIAKLGAETRTQAVAIGLRNGLIE